MTPQNVALKGFETFASFEPCRSTTFSLREAWLPMFVLPSKPVWHNRYKVELLFPPSKL